MLAKKQPFPCCLPAKHQNAAKLALQTQEKNRWTFFVASCGRRRCFRNHLTNFGSFTKVPFPVETVIPWCDSGSYQELSCQCMYWQLGEDNPQYCQDLFSQCTQAMLVAVKRKLITFSSKKYNSVIYVFLYTTFTYFL